MEKERKSRACNDLTWFRAVAPPSASKLVSVKGKGKGGKDSGTGKGKNVEDTDRSMERAQGQLLGGRPLRLRPEAPLQPVWRRSQGPGLQQGPAAAEAGLGEARGASSPAPPPQANPRARAGSEDAGPRPADSPMSRQGFSPQTALARKAKTWDDFKRLRVFHFLHHYSGTAEAGLGEAVVAEASRRGLCAAHTSLRPEEEWHRPLG